MGPLGIAARAALSYIVLMVLVRITGKRTIRQGTAFDFTVALIVGDLVDDVIWAEVSSAQFLVACSTLFLLHWLVQVVCTAPGAASRESYR